MVWHHLTMVDPEGPQTGSRKRWRLALLYLFRCASTGQPGRADSDKVSQLNAPNPECRKQSLLTQTWSRAPLHLDSGRAWQSDYTSKQQSQQGHLGGEWGVSTKLSLSYLCLPAFELFPQVSTALIPACHDFLGGASIDN